MLQGTYKAVLHLVSPVQYIYEQFIYFPVTILSFTVDFNFDLMLIIFNIYAVAFTDGTSVIMFYR